MSKQLRDSAFRLFPKIIRDIENKRFKRAFEGLDKAEKIELKIKDPELSYHIFFFKGFAEDEMNNPELALEYYIRALEIVEKLFLEKPENKEYQSFIDSIAAGIGKVFIDLDDDEKAKQYIEAVKPHFDRALQTFEILLKSKPENPNYLSGYLEVMDGIESCYHSWGMTDEIIRLFDRKLDIYEKLLETGTKDSIIIQKLDEDIEDIGFLCLSQEKNELAEQIYKRGIRIYEKVLKNDPGFHLAAFSMIYTYDYLGTMYSDLESFEKAEQYYKEGVEVLKQRREAYPEEISYLVTLANMYKNLGLVFSASEETEKSRPYYMEARKVYQELINRYPEEFMENEILVKGLDDLGNMFEEADDPNNAELCYKDALQFYEKLYETNPKDPDYLLKVSDILYELGNLFLDLEQIEQASEYYKEIIKLYDAYLEENPDDIDFRKYRADTLTEIGELYAEKDVEIAKGYFEEARQFFEEAMRLEPENDSYQEGLFNVLSAAGKLFRAQGDYEKAIEQYAQIETVLQKLIESEPEMPTHHINLASIFFWLAVLNSEKGNSDKEAEYHTLALEKYKKELSENQDDPLFLQLFAHDLEAIGINMLDSISCKVKDSEILYRYYNLACSVYEKLSEAYPEDEEFQTMLAIFVENLGTMDMRMNRFERSRDELEYLLTIVEKMQDSNTDEHAHQIMLGTVLNDLGILYSLLQDIDKSQQALEKGISLNKKLLESEPENLEYQEQAAILFTNYSNVLNERGKTEEAERFKAKAEEINAKLGLSSEYL
jgi:tetratricopeptide (TPR) repeat protein